MSAEIQDDLVTGSIQEFQEDVKQTETPTDGDLLNFGDDDDDQQPISSTTGIDGGIEELQVKGSNEKEVKTSIEDQNIEEKTEIVETVSSSTKDDNDDNKGSSSELNLKSPIAKFLTEQKVSANVIKIIYWQNVYKTAGIFGGLLFLMISMFFYTLLSVITNFGIAVLAVAFLYRIGMTVVNAVQKTSAEHPFKNLLEENIEVSEEMVDTCATCVRNKINCTVKSLQKLFLIEDVFQSLKFGLMLWLVSYIGQWMSPLTIVVLGVIIIFTVPKIYEEKQEQIDQVILTISQKMKESVAQVEAKLPEKVMAFMKKDKKE